jgi:uncharacterized protein YndB with AHSA1/START domain
MIFLRSEIGEEPVIVEGVLRAPVARVFHAWTDPEEIIKWFGLESGAMRSAQIDLRVGGKWCFVMQEGEEGRQILQGEYIAIQPEKRLEFSWRHVREHADGKREETPDSKVTVTFRADGASTHVHLRHEGILHQDGRLGVGRGWDATFEHLGDWLKQAG